VVKRQLQDLLSDYMYVIMGMFYSWSRFLKLLDIPWDWVPL